MALKDFLQSLSKKPATTKEKNEVAATLIASNDFPIIPASAVNLTNYSKVPLMGLAALGTAFAQLPEAARTLTTTTSQTLTLNEPLYRALNLKNVAGYLSQNAHGTVGNIMRVNEQGKHVIAGHMTFSQVSTLPLSQTTTTILPVDPMTMVIAAALFTIDQKLDSLQRKAEEILQFLKLEKQTRQRGNLNTLQDILTEFKQDCHNEPKASLRLIAVQDIKREAQQDILFYQEQVNRRLQEQQGIHGSQKADSLLDTTVSDFTEYQLACYLFGFATFMEVMLQKEFDTATLHSTADKLQTYAEQYSKLFAECHAQLAAYQRSAVEARLLGGLSTFTKAAGTKLASVPVLNKGTVDEALISAGESLSNLNRNTLARKLESLTPLEDCRLLAFVDYVHTLDRMCNQEQGLLTDGEYLYIQQTV